VTLSTRSRRRGCYQIKDNQLALVEEDKVDLLDVLKLFNEAEEGLDTKDFN
jgi:hypothetical protein